MKIKDGQKIKHGRRIKRVSLDDVRAARSRHAQKLLSLNPVHGVGVGQARGGPAITVYVVPGASRRGIPPRVDGVPVVIKEAERFRAF